MMFVYRAAAAIAILLAALSTRAEDTTKYDLKYKFKSGEVVRSAVVHKATVVTTIKGVQQTAETRTGSIKLWRISSAKSDGTVTFTNMVESVDMWQKMQGRQEQRYQSQKDKNPPPGYEQVAKGVGVPLTEVTMDARGKVLKREEKLKQPNNGPTQITMPLPEEPVAIGHEWKVPFEVTVTGTNGGAKQVEMRQVYVLKSVATGVATIEMETEALTPVNDPTLEAQLIQRMTNGTVKFDIDAGRVMSQVTDLDRRVIGFSGPASSMHYLTRLEENLMVPTPKTAPKAATKEPKTVPKTARKPKR